MPNESFFMAFGSLGLTLAGFAGLISALRSPEAARDPITGYRIRTIVALGLTLTFVGFGTVVAYSVFGDVAIAARIGTLIMSIAFGRGLLIDVKPGPAWPPGTQTLRMATIVVLLFFLVGAMANLILGSVPFLQVLMILGLVGPLTIFYNTIRDATTE